MLLAASQGFNAVGWAIALGIGGTFFMIGLSMSAFVLKLSCRTAGVDVPDTGKAMVISFLESLVGMFAYLAALLAVSFLGGATNVQHATLAATVVLSFIALSFVVPAGIYVPMLRVTFTRGLIISIMRYVITLSILAVFAYAIAMFKSGAIKR